MTHAPPLDELCQCVVPETRRGKWAQGGGLVCMRRRGHKGKHMSLARAALLADGFCPDCGQKPEENHPCKVRFRGMP